LRLFQSTKMEKYCFCDGLIYGNHIFLIMNRIRGDVLILKKCYEFATAFDKTERLRIEEAERKLEEMDNFLRNIDCEKTDQINCKLTEDLWHSAKELEGQIEAAFKLELDTSPVVYLRVRREAEEKDCF